jgi:predicted nucleotide-binding protein
LQRKDDIDFLNSFRDKIDQYLFAGYAPCVDPEAHEYDGEALDKVNAKLQMKEYGELRRAINEMIPRTKSLLAECGITPIVTNYPPSNVGGPVMRFHLLDLVTENSSEFRIPKSRVLDTIDQAIGMLRTKGSPKPAAGEILSAPTSKKIFIVHGKDEENTKILKEMLVQWGFEPIIMIEEPHMGRTLIEKLIALKSDVGYVFVLMTPDDVGIGRTELAKLLEGFQAATGHHPADATELAALLALKGRARQNVIFEYGLFMGHLGREKVCLLKKGTVDFPTDLLGLAYIEFNEKVSEEECKKQIERELNTAFLEQQEKNESPILIGRANATLTLDLKSKTSRSKIHLYCISISGNPEVLKTAAENVEANLAPLPASGVLASVVLPWVANLEGNLSKSLDLEGDVDFQNARDVIRSMSNYVKYEKATLAHRIGQHVVAFFGLESTGKIYLANKEPIELGRPIEGQMPACEFILGVSGSNIMLTQSDTYVAFASSWDNIGVGIKRPFPLRVS